MNDARRVFSLVFISAALIAVPALAQEGEPTASPQQPERGHRARDGRGRLRPGREHRAGMRLGHLPGANLFERLPEDKGPLTPEEQLELLSFLRSSVPKVYCWLEQLRERDPAAFERQLQRAAPRLRQLHRIFERDPDLGENLVRYSENLQRMRRARRAWTESEHDPALRERISAAARRMTAQNLRIEVAVLEDRAEQLEQQREQRIAADVERWQSDDVDVAGESEAVREVVGAWRAAQTDDERQTLTDELRRMSFEQVDREIARLRNRAARLRENAVKEVDRRMQRWREQTERGPQPRAGPRRDGERRGDNERKRRHP